MQFKSRFFWLLLILIGALVSSYASVQKEVAQGTDALNGLLAHSEAPNMESSYIRHNFYQSVNRITDQPMLACCDLIMIDFKSDIATEVPFTNRKSLTKAITNVLDGPSNGKKK